MKWQKPLLTQLSIHHDWRVVNNIKPLKVLKTLHERLNCFWEFYSLESCQKCTKERDPCQGQGHVRCGEGCSVLTSHSEVAEPPLIPQGREVANKASKISCHKGSIRKVFRRGILNASRKYHYSKWT